jgi:hypothetical protein
VSCRLRYRSVRESAVEKLVFSVEVAERPQLNKAAAENAKKIKWIRVLFMDLSYTVGKEKRFCSKK